MSAQEFAPDAVAASMSRGDGGFGREQSRYYDHPILRKPHWRWEIVWYFFIGGAAAASGALSLLGERDPEDAALVRNGRYTALLGASLSGALLIKDLGRPERFLNMMRIVKLKSPMSVGVWSLMAFSAGGGLSALQQAKHDRIIGTNPLSWAGLLRRPLLAIGSLMMAGYTGVLLSATAIPVWFRGRRHLPAIFVLSATTTGCALQNALIAAGGGSARTQRKLELIETIAALAEAALLLDYERTTGETGKALFGGARGARLRRWTLGIGIGIPALLTLPALMGKDHGAKPHRLRPLVAAACALAGGYILRDAVVTAGRDSADDARAYLRRPE